MEPRREQPEARKPRPAQKPRRFRLIKLEERIAPSAGGGTKNCYSDKCTGAHGCSTECTTLSIE
jgi:hypothetical protein